MTPTQKLNQLREERPWQIEYRFRRKQGYSERKARQLADAYVLESEALIAAQETGDAPAPVKHSPSGYKLYWCASANRYVSVPED